MDDERESMIPQSVGLYWGRTRGCRWWNLLVMVRGDVPFFRLDILDAKEDKFYKDLSPYYVEEFGPKIVDGPPGIVGKRDDWS